MLEKSLNYIDKLHKENYVHRKGFTLQSITDLQILNHTKEEIDELIDTLPNPDIMEFCDALACMLHFMKRYKWTWDQIDDHMYKKLVERFKKSSN